MSACTPANVATTKPKWWPGVSRWVAHAALAAVGVANTLAWAPAHADSPSAAKQVEAIVRNRLAALGAPGGSVAVLYQGRTELAKGFGLANLEFNVSANQYTLFPLASVTKLVTSLAILRLVESGHVSVDDPIGKYVEGLPETWRGVPIYNLMNHTSGLPEFHGTPEWDSLQCEEEENPATSKSFDDVLKLVATKPLEFRLGSRWRYNQTNYVLLAKLIEATTSRPFEEIVRDTVLRPAGMTTAAYSAENAAVILNHNPSVYRFKDGQFISDPQYFPRSVHSAAGLNASADDVAHFLRYLDRETSSENSAFALGWAERYRMRVDFSELDDEPLKNQPVWDYALGWVVLHHRTQMGVGHGGGGDYAWIVFFPEARLGIGVMLNLAGNHAYDLMLEIADVYLGSAPTQ